MQYYDSNLFQYGELHYSRLPENQTRAIAKLILPSLADCAQIARELPEEYNIAYSELQEAIFSQTLKDQVALYGSWVCDIERLMSNGPPIPFREQ